MSILSEASPRRSPRKSGGGGGALVEDGGVSSSERKVASTSKAREPAASTGGLKRSTSARASEGSASATKRRKSSGRAKRDEDDDYQEESEAASEPDTGSDFEETTSEAEEEAAEEEDYSEEDVPKRNSPRKKGKGKATNGKAKGAEADDLGEVKPVPKPPHGLSGKELIRQILPTAKPEPNEKASSLPVRAHSLTYHYPAILRGDERGAGARSALLQWYESVQRDRKMPWRQERVDESAAASSDERDELGAQLKRHAYRVWISEIMLQQTRVATVIDYFIRWMAKWPSIEDLAEATEEEVLAAWKGLGYYSRSARIHQAAKKVVADKRMQGLLPQLPDELVAKVPGVGPYTAGAISSIVFGHAVPLLDGNVARVLARQAGLLANTKEKALTDLLWEIARRLVRRAALDADKEEVAKLSEQEQRSAVVGGDLLPRSDVPGAWNQALMELGSTICTPHPTCNKCPISSTCKAYQEGLLSATGKSSSANGQEPAIVDIEDQCVVCESVPVVESDVAASVAASASKKGSTDGFKQAKLSFGKVAVKPVAPKTPTDEATAATVHAHVKLFPWKVEKSKVKEEHCAVCIIASPEAAGDTKRSLFLLEQRPNKGLLASMWQFPTLSFGNGEPPAAKERLASASNFAATIVKRYPPAGMPVGVRVGAGKTLTTIKHVFTHLVLHMHIYAFTLQPGSKDAGVSTDIADMPRKWCTPKEVLAINMGTGNANAWQTYAKYNALQS